DGLGPLRRDGLGRGAVRGPRIQQVAQVDGPLLELAAEAAQAIGAFHGRNSMTGWGFVTAGWPVRRRGPWPGLTKGSAPGALPSRARSRCPDSPTPVIALRGGRPGAKDA